MLEKLAHTPGAYLTNLRWSYFIMPCSGSTLYFIVAARKKKMPNLHAMGWKHEQFCEILWISFWLVLVFLI